MKLRVWQQVMVMVFVPIAFLVAELVAVATLCGQYEQVSNSIVQSRSVLLRYQMEMIKVFSALLKISTIVVPSAPAPDFQSLRNDLSRAQMEAEQKSNEPDTSAGSNLRADVNYAVTNAGSVFADVLRLARKRKQSTEIR